MTGPQAFYFGSEKRPLFGWLHPASRQGGAKVGLVICSPFGFEEECAHKSLRQLALDAAAAGIPTLRFDYASCGNSAGDEFAPHAFTAWIESVGAAMDALKAQAGVASVCLVGLRLGATLSALASMVRSDVAALVAIAPVVQGKAYVRELKILGMTGFQGTSAAVSDDLMQASGYVLAKETREALAGVDLRAANALPAPKVLIIERDDMNPAPEWAQTLEKLGAQVEQLALPGYRDMMSDPQQTVVPAKIIAATLDFIGKLAHEPLVPIGAPVQLLPVQPSCSLQTGGGLAVRETPVQITLNGADLFGILCQPERAVARAPAERGVAVVLISSGTLHNIGPGRLWPTLSRHWAAQGATVLRVDLPGIGESTALANLGENRVYSQQYMQSLAQTLSYMRSRIQDADVHLVGLCSGATHAFKAAAQQQEWSSFVLINPLTFAYEEAGESDTELKDYEVQGAASKYKKMIFSAGPWKKLLSGQLDIGFICKVLTRNMVRVVTAVAAKAARAGGERSAFELELDAATKPRKALQFVFCENAIGEQFLRSNGGEVLDALLKSRAVTIDFVADSDHTFTRLDARNRLTAILDEKFFPKN